MQQTKQQESHYSEYDNLAFHPWNVMLMLTLFAIVALFLATSIAFIYNRVQNDTGTLAIPWLFGFNTLILLGSSWTMWRAKKAYEGDNKPISKVLVGHHFLSLLFLGMQFVAWSQLFAQNVFVNTNNSASYLYVLSGLHFAHVIAGLPFLILFLRAARLQMKEPVTVLVYFSDPEKRLKLRLLSIYWHFLDALWVFLVLFLLANYLIR